MYFLVNTVSVRNAVTTNLTYDLYIAEEEDAGFVGEIPDIKNSKVIFADQISEKYLRVDVALGVIFTRKKIDRDILMKDTMHFVVISVNKPPIEVSIHIKDINDNHPTFMSAVQYFTFDESANIGDKVLIIPAYDIDDDLNGFVSNYTIQSADRNHIFRVQYDIFSKSLYLVLTSKLDREYVSNYLFKLTAYDSGSPKLSGSCLLNVTVRDVNDNTPTFESSYMELNVMENTTVGTQITCFNVTDPDEDTNSMVSYTLHGTHAKNFSISQNGCLKLTMPLDFEQYQEMDLTVVAKDHGIPTLESRATLKLHVIDVNDNAPIVQILKGPNITIEEGILPTILSLISVHDADSEITNGNITLELTNHRDIFKLTKFDLSVSHTIFSREIFTSEKIYFVLRIKSILDREQHARYNLSLLASDGTYSTRTSAIISVADKNDNAPNFIKTVRRMTVDAVTPIGSFIALLRAIDTDEGLNGDVTYEIEHFSPCNSFFKINNQTRILVTTSALDQCKYESFVLSISARDHGSPPLKGLSNISITLSNFKSACIPKFIHNSSRNLTMVDNISIGSKIAEFTAICERQGHIVTYFLEGEHKSLFSLHPITGILYLRRRFEGDMFITLNVIAFNLRNPKLNKTLRVFINAVRTSHHTSMYRHELKVIHLNNKNYTNVIGAFSVDKNEKYGKKYTYNITKGNNDDAFLLNNTSAELFLTANFTLRDCALLEITATDGESLGVLNVFMLVKDSPNTNITFTRTSYTFYIQEGTPMGGVVGHTKVTESGDTGDYFLQSGNELGYFSIDKNGYIIAAKKILHQTDQTYNLTVVYVTDCIKTKTKVIVVITDLNNHAPVFTSRNMVTIPDTTKICSVIYNSSVEDLDVGESGKISFELHTDHEKLFRISNETGQIFLQRSLTREVYNLVIVARDQGSPSLQSSMILTIIVNETQNRVPVFTSRDIDIVVDVNQTIYEPFYEVKGDDEDSGKNGRTMFYVDSEEFGIYPNGLLYAKQDLQTIKFSFHELIIYLHDSGQPSLQVNMSALIYIDCHISSALFTNSIYYINITENIELNTTIGYVPLQPSITNTNLFLETKNRYVDLIGQDLVIKDEIDRERINQRCGNNLIILRIHGSRDTDSDTCLIVIRVLDDNDHPPKFVRKQARVSLSTSDRLQILAEDGDIYPNDIVRYKIIDSAEVNQVVINNTTGEIDITSFSKHPKKNKFVLEILAYDPTRPEFNDTLNLTVFTSTGRNENPPVRSNQANLTIELYENETLGSVFAILNATDADGYSFLTYHIKDGNSNRRFTIHPITGQLQLIAQLDFETCQQYDLKITVDDGIFTDYTYVKVNIKDINDNKPLFQNSSVIWNIDNNAVSGTKVGACAVRDLDKDDVLVYSLKGNSKGAKYFSIDQNNCEVFLSTDGIKLDSSEVTLSISVTDGLHSSTLDITVVQNIVTPPIIASSLAAVVNSDVKPSTTRSIYDIRVEEKIRKHSQYFLAGGVYASIFRVNRSHGHLYLESAWPSNTWCIVLQLKVVSNNGHETSFSLLLFKATTRDIKFQHSLYYASAKENSGSEVYLLEPKAINTRDISKNSHVTYHITNGAYQHYFKLNQTNGRIFIAKELDREKLGSTVVLTVFAVDLTSSLSQTAFTTVHITILDENDNYPIFNNPNAEVTTSEDCKVSSVVANMSASDDDAGSNGEVVYVIVSGDPNSTFSINTSTGIVTVAVPLDREKMSRYILNISASDKSLEPKVSYTTLTVTVADINDNRPTFNQSTLHFSLISTANVGTVVGIVTALDEDEGMNGEVYYKITAGGYGYFSIDGMSGRITTKKNIDFENRQLFILTIIAYDGSDDVLSSNATVFITINDVTYHPTLFRQSEYHVEVLENATQNNVVFSLKNEVVGYNGHTYFEIISGNEKDVFGVSANGDMIVKDKLDRELKSDYILRVSVSSFKEESICPRSYTTVYVKITDVNDNYPYFKIPPLISVRENTPPGSIIARLKAHDADSGRNAVLSYKQVNNESVSSVDLNGQIKLLTFLDYESKKEHVFTVLVCDHGTPQLCLNQSARLVVEDVNDNWPIFEKHDQEIYLTEMVNSNYPLMTLNARDKDSGLNGQLGFQILSFANLFKIDKDHGVLTLKDDLYIPNNKYDIQARVFDHGIPQRSNTTQFVLYVNILYPPKFKEKSYNLKLRENIGPISFFALVEAVVNHTKNISNLIYSINNGSYEDYFSISSKTGVISLLKPVDREKIQSFNLTVKVEDGSKLSLYDKTLVHISILDENDNPPIIDNTNVNTTIKENINGGARVIAVKAFDLDKGENSTLKFSLLNFDTLFSIDQNTGDVKTIVSLDHEQQTSYQLTVQVSDCGTPKRSSFANFTVFISDVNDNPPMFTQKRYQINIQQGLPVNSFVFQLTAHDKDSLQNSLMKYGMKNSSMFKLHELTGIITTKKVIPPKDVTFTLEVTVFDPLIPLYHDKAIIVVAVLTSGRFPVVYPTVAFVQLLEEDATYITRSFAQVNGSSPLDGISGSVKYSIANLNDNLFLVTDGKLFLRQELDYEKQSRYVVRVRVSDSQQPPLHSYAKFIIYVVNINDNPPRFTHKMTRLKVRENEPNDTTIFQLRAYDIDDPDTVMRFYLNDSINFSINQTNGKISTRVIFDYEIKSCYSVLATVFDVSNVNHADTTLLVVEIENVNDNPPITTQQYNIIIPEDFPVGKPFLTIEANDADKLGNLKFSVTAAIFAVGATTGDLSLTSTLDREKIDFYEFNVTVTDGLLLVNSTIRLNVSDVNDCPPHFKNNTIILHAYENSSLNTMIYTIHLYDEDLGNNSKSLVSLSQSDPVINEYFNLTKDGSIILLKNVSLSGKPRNFTFSITAHNIEPPQYNASANVIINVIDVNDHPPVFNQSTYTSYTLYSTRVGKIVTSVFAYDLYDLDDNQVVSYDIVGGNGTSYFVIDNNGDIRVKNSLQRHIKSWLYLAVVARDGGYPAMKSYCLVKIYIEEKNVFPPLIRNTLYVKVIPENTPPHREVLKIHAQDYESKSDLTYKIISGSDRNWYISQNGALMFKNPLDYEVKQSYKLLVAVFDRNFLNQKSSTATFYITVTDINDNKPVFNQSSYVKTISEDFHNSNVIITVYATDIDSPVNNKISYRIQTGDSRFLINSYSGEITSTKKFDYEIKSVYSLVVTATDNGSPPLSSDINVTLYIYGVNEFAPKFTATSYNFSTMESVTKGTVIGQVNAVDKDKGIDSLCSYLQTIPPEYGIIVNSSTGSIQSAMRLSPGKITFDVVVQNYNFDLRFIDLASVTIDVLYEGEHPVFHKQLYRISTYENTSISTPLIKVQATITEVNNSLIEYNIQNASSMFSIEKNTGIIRLAKVLDRELVDFYNLTLIAACKNGTSVLRGYSTLSVTVLDINDNPPTVKDCFGAVRENSPVGTPILLLQVEDNDTLPNAGPFTYHTETFRDIFSVNQTTGVLSNMAAIDYETDSRYEFVITISDNGRPKLSSQVKCFISALDENDNRGNERHSKVIVNFGRSKEDFIVNKTNTMYVGDLSPTDVDVNDTYHCKLGDTTRKGLYFQVNTCKLYASVSPTVSKDLSISYNGSVGDVETLVCSSKIQYHNISTTRYPATIMLHLKDVMIQDFVNSSLIKFEEHVNLKISHSKEQLAKIISVQAFNKGLNLVFAVSAAVRKDAFVQSMVSNADELLRVSRSSKIDIDVNLCLTNSCNINSKCEFSLDFTRKEIIDTESVIFHSLVHTVNKTCACLPGWVGEKCNQRPQSCFPNPCQNNRTCKGKNVKIRCICGKFFTGEYCELDVNECNKSPCENSGKCVNKYGGFKCVCNDEFTGEFCETKITACHSNPCNNNGRCIPVGNTFQCECQFGDYGKQCDKQSLNFDAVSYMKRDSINMMKQFSYYVEFASVEASALLLLLYSNGSSIGVQINNGRLEISLSNRKEVSQLTNNVHVSDGVFHSLEILITQKIISMVVDKRFRVSTSQKLSSISTNHTLSIGGIESTDLIRRFARYLSAIDFIGCMRNIVIINATMTKSDFIASNGVRAGCRRTKGCDSNSCGVGQCIDLWSEVECRCKDGYTAKSCQKAYKSVKLQNSPIRLKLSESYKRKMLLNKDIRIRRVALIENSSILMQFRTRKKEGVLFNSTCNRGYTQLYLNDGKIHYASSLNNITSATSLSEASVADGKWHNVSMLVRGSIVSIVLDLYQSTKHIYGNSLHQFFSTEVNEILFGKEFEGCLGKLKLNENALYLSSSTRLFDVSASSLVSLGCASTDVCQSNPCENKTLKHCVDDWEAYSCVAPGICVNKPCRNKGRCRPVGTASFSCDCSRTDHVGRVCEISKLCVPNPCKLNEICSLENSNYTCTVEKVKKLETAFLDEEIIITITLCAIVFISTVIGCFAARRRWQGKTFVKGTFEKGFDNHGRELDDLDQIRRCKETNKSHLNRSNLSLPTYANERDQHSGLSRYKSVDIPLQKFRSTDEIANIQRGISSEHVTSQESLGDRFTLRTHQVTPPIESGFESTGSDIVCHRPNNALVIPEAYDLDDASIGYSEMSFRYDNGSSTNFPTMPFTMDDVSVITDTVFGSEISEATYTTESDSDASFTCSECDYGKSSYNRGRRNPAYIFSLAERSKKSTMCEECEHFSDTSSYNTSLASFTTSERTTRSRHRSLPSRHRRRKRSIDVRHVLNSHMFIRNSNIHSSKEHLGHDNICYELEKVPESVNEEYV